MFCITARRICDLKSFCQSEVLRRWESFCGFLRSFFLKSPLKQGLERSFNSLRKTKEKARQCRAFCVYYMLGLPPQTRTQRTFREKSFGISKAFAKVKWYVRREILLPTFLIRKVGGTPFSERKVCYSVFMEYPMPRIVDMIFMPNFSSSFSLRYLI